MPASRSGSPVSSASHAENLRMPRSRAITLAASRPGRSTGRPPVPGGRAARPPAGSRRAVGPAAVELPGNEFLDGAPVQVDGAPVALAPVDVQPQAIGV